jgi:hypothetical protein
MGGSASVNLSTPPIDEIKLSLEDRSDDAVVLIASTLASHDIDQMRMNLIYDQSSMNQMLDPLIWRTVRVQVINNLADCYATSATGVSTATKK